VNSIDWIAELGSEPYIFVVRKGSHIHNMSDLVKAIRADAGKIDIAGFVKGSGSDIAWEMFLGAAHLSDKDANWVPYSSVAAGVTAVLGGHGVATVAYVDLVKGEVAAGNLRIIGAMAAKRLSGYPDVPTLAEQGLNVPSGWQQWRGVIAPAGMPEAIQAKLADAIHQAMQTSDMQDFLKHASVEYDFKGPKAFTAFAHEQDAITAAWMKKLGMIP
jgi:putative tricarboxylic transport membrane protein